MNRRLFAVLAVATATLMTAPDPARAQDATGNSSSLQVPVSGKVNGKQAAGVFTIKKFGLVGQEVRAIGIFSLADNQGKATVIAGSMPLVLPKANASASSVSDAAALAAVAPGATCDILHLTLGPLDLNLLGLVVHLDQVNLDVTAESGPGNLLGNLLCAVANLLNGPNLAGLLQQLVDALNALLNAL